MLFSSDCNGFEELLLCDQIYYKWLTRLVSFLCFNLFNTYCFLSFSYYSMAIYFYKDSFPSLIKIDYCNFTFCLMLSSNSPSSA